MEKHILVIGGMRLAHERIKKLGARMTLINRISKLKESDRSLYDRVISVSDAAPLQEWISLAKTVNQLDPFTGVANFHERNQLEAATIASELGLEFSCKPHITETVKNKALMRQHLALAGIDYTPFALVSTLSEAEAFCTSAGLPIIIKPVDGWGSTGVSKVTSAKELAYAFEWLSQTEGSQCLVEMFLEGEEFSVEAITHQGVHHIICVTKKFLAKEHCIELGHVVPASISQEKRGCISRYVIDVLNALQIERGATHTELILTTDGPRIVETHLRLGGDCIPELIENVSSVDLFDVLARQVCGEDISTQLPSVTSESQAKFSAIWFATPKAQGILEAVEGLELLKSLPGCRRYSFMVEPGKLIGGVKDSFSRCIYLIADGETGSEAVSRAQKALSKLKFRVLEEADLGQQT